MFIKVAPSGKSLIPHKVHFGG